MRPAKKHKVRRPTRETTDNENPPVNRSHLDEAAENPVSITRVRLVVDHDHRTENVASDHRIGIEALARHVAPKIRRPPVRLLCADATHAVRVLEREEDRKKAKTGKVTVLHRILALERDLPNTERWPIDPRSVSNPVVVRTAPDRRPKIPGERFPELHVEPAEEKFEGRFGRREQNLEHWYRPLPVPILEKPLVSRIPLEPGV